VNVHRYADRPDLLAIRWETLAQPAFPEYMNHNVPGNKYWGRLYEDFPDFQLAPLYVREGIGRHVEPNVWLRHRL
jgi:hypothetical protein